MNTHLKKRRIISMFCVLLMVFSLLPQHVAKAACSHTYKWEVTKAATCTTNGEQVYRCTKCKALGMGANSYQTIPKQGHNFQWEITKQATTTQEGQQVYRCTRCKELGMGSNSYQTIPKIVYKYAECIDYPTSSGPKNNKLAKVTYNVNPNDISDTIHVAGWAIHDLGVESYSYELTGNGVKIQGKLFSFLRNEAALVKELKKYTSKGWLTTSNYNTNTGFEDWISTKDLPGGTYTITITLNAPGGIKQIIGQITVNIENLVYMTVGDTRYGIPKNSTVKISQYTSGHTPKCPYGYHVEWFNKTDGSNRSIQDTITLTHNIEIVPKVMENGCLGKFYDKNHKIFNETYLKTGISFYPTCEAPSGKVFVGWKMIDDPKVDKKKEPEGVLYLPGDFCVVDNSTTKYFEPVFQDAGASNFQRNVFVSTPMLIVMKEQTGTKLAEIYKKLGVTNTLNADNNFRAAAYGIFGTALAAAPTLFTPLAPVEVALVAVGTVVSVVGIIVGAVCPKDTTKLEIEKNNYEAKYEFYDSAVSKVLSYNYGLSRVYVNVKKTQSGSIVYEIPVQEIKGY